MKSILMLFGTMLCLGFSAHANEAVEGANDGEICASSEFELETLMSVSDTFTAEVNGNETDLRDCPTNMYDRRGRLLGTNHENSCRSAYNECVRTLQNRGICGYCVNQEFNSGLIGRCGGGGGGRDCPAHLYVRGRYIRSFHDNRCAESRRECENFARRQGYRNYRCVN